MGRKVAETATANPIASESPSIEAGASAGINAAPDDRVVGASRRSFAWILHNGLDAYEEFFAWISRPNIAAALSERDAETVRSLPEPQPTLPLRVLASLGHHAATGALKFHYTLPDSASDLRDWTTANREHLERLAPDAFVAQQLWREWTPPRVLASGSVPVSWNEILAIAMDFAKADEMGTSSLAFVLLRDWAFRVRELADELELDLDGALEAILELLAAGIDPPDIERVQQLEKLVRERAGGQYPTVWSIVVALALDGGPLHGRVRVDEVDFTSELGTGERSEPATGGTGRSGEYRPSTTITSDAATTQDLLQYELYADAIARFISDERTVAPLTIGIKAPWGAGKTSLMRMVQRKLDPGGVPHGETPDHLSNGELLDQVRRPPEEAARQLAREPLPGRSRRTTVWFNAWKYQSGDQVWAGLAHAIIAQVEQRMTVAERERFWASLNVKRLDLGEIRRRIHMAFLERLAVYLVALPFGVITLVFVALASPAGAALGGTVLSGTAFADIAYRWRKFKNEPAGTSNPQLVRDPGYDGRLGFLHLMHDDLQRVLDLVATPELPLVVFIDDLDRCSYTTVAQVIEALNTFLAGDFNNCVFVIAMEPDLVAAQIHVAYRDLFEHMAKRGGPDAGDLGWRFLEKMVQLPLTLPPPQDSQLGQFMGSLVNTRPETSSELEDDDQTVIEARARIERARGRDLSLAGLESALEQAKTAEPTGDGADAIPDAAFERAARLAYANEFDDRTPEIQALLHRHVVDLDRNPREIKRFLNVFRFYAYVSFWRRSGGVDAPDLDGVAKLAMLAVRCPHLLSMLGTGSRLAELEAAAADNEAWAEAVGRLPTHVREELAAPTGVRAMVGRDPRVGDRAAGFL